MITRTLAGREILVELCHGCRDARTAEDAALLASDYPVIPTYLLCTRCTEQTEIRCRCGYTGPPMTDPPPAWWPMMGRFIGTCPECHQSPSFDWEGP